MQISVIKRNGALETFDPQKIKKAVYWACENLNVDPEKILEEANIQLFDQIKTKSIQEALVSSAAHLISIRSPDYSYAAARLLLQTVYKDVNDGNIEYPSLANYIHRGIHERRLDSRLGSKFDLYALNKAIRPERDLQFDFLGMKTITDRYLIRAIPTGKEKEGGIIEMPQHFWMRVAMGIAINEREPTRRAAEFYELLSKFEFVSSTPTLFNSGTLHPQMSSCFLNTVEDSIDGIFETIHECANLSKYAGGIGTDWSRVRPAGDTIIGTNGKSSGVVPYLKVFNDTAVAVNQGGKRKGSFAAYLEPWHADFLDFIDLKKNSGDERRRAHDIFPAAWVNDLFMRRVQEDGVWHFFSPVDVKLTELWGTAFEVEYIRLEKEHPEFIRGEIKARDLWRKILNSLFETGHPWITFKDEHNRRNPQSHVGIIRSSNLCTEISLVTDDQNTAVCNLGSINLGKAGDDVDVFLKRVTPTAVRMLDNVIDINFYPSEKAERSNKKHRPVGLGVMGYAEYLAKKGIDFESYDHLEEAHCLFERLAFEAIKASAYLSGERGAYPSYKGSLWSQGILPIDTARNLSELDSDIDFPLLCDWQELREIVMTYGMRNSNVTSIAPTATIANIVGTSETIQPTYELVTQKENLSGTFTVIDPCLRWVDTVKTAYEIDQGWIVSAAAVRQKFIDQAQSLNLFVDPERITGQGLSDIYEMAWEYGLKSTYYLRSKSAKIKATVEAPVDEAPKACSIENPDCESCQ